MNDINITKKPGRPKLAQGRKIPKMITLSGEALKYLNYEAIRSNRSVSNVIETLLLEEKRKFDKDK